MKKQIIDQSAHVTAAFVVLMPLLVYPHVLSAALTGFGLGLIREVTEGGNVFSPNSLLDMAFWAAGGALAFLVLA